MEDRENWSKWSPFAKIYDALQSGSIDGTDTIPHDRALIRAMEAKYIPPNKNVATPDAEKTLFVGRLDHKTTEDNLKCEFSRYGTVTQCRVVRDVVTGFSRGYAFVQYKRSEEAEKARRNAHRIVLDGREILVEWENGRTMPGWIPRRLGGGFGGKKESGQLRFGGRDRPFRKPIVIKPLSRNNPKVDEDDGEGQKQDDEEEESRKNSSRTEYQYNDAQGLRDDKSSRQYPGGKISKPWDRRNPGTSGVRTFWREKREDERRYSGKSQRDSYEWQSHKRGEQSRKYSSKRDWNERNDTREREHQRFSSKSSRDWDERDDTYKPEDSRRYYSHKSSRDQRDWKDQEDSNEKERRNPHKSSREHEGDFEDRDDTRQLSSVKQEDQPRDERSRRSRDWGDPDEWEDSRERRSEKKKSKRSRRDREDRGELDDSSQVRVKVEEGDWEVTPERLDRDKNRKDGGDKWQDSPEKGKRLSGRSREGSDAEDDTHNTRKSKKRKKHSKKRDRADSDDSYERKKEKKKKHKKSRE